MILQSVHGGRGGGQGLVSGVEVVSERERGGTLLEKCAGCHAELDSMRV